MRAASQSANIGPPPVVACKGVRRYRLRAGRAYAGLFAATSPFMGPPRPQTSARAAELVTSQRLYGNSTALTPIGPYVERLGPLPPSPITDTSRVPDRPLSPFAARPARTSLRHRRPATRPRKNTSRPCLRRPLAKIGTFGRPRPLLI